MDVAEVYLCYLKQLSYAVIQNDQRILAIIVVLVFWNKISQINMWMMHITQKQAQVTLV